MKGRSEKSAIPVERCKLEKAKSFEGKRNETGAFQREDDSTGEDRPTPILKTNHSKLDRIFPPAHQNMIEISPS
jgi:hypothetical protein